ncbi:MAG: DUF3823 domain-containing protein [Chitinophagaceae bacterium]
MNKIKLMLLIAGMISLVSCSKDNYDAPNAGLHGSFIDDATNELVQQDIIGGTQIEFIEHGYDPFEIQTMIVKTDGTYANSLMFANTYTIQPKRGNFVELAPQDLQVNGQTQLDFRVVPYIRVLQPSITIAGTIVTATFKLQQTVVNNVRKIGLYVHSDSRVGEPMRLVASEQNLNAPSDPNTTYTLTMDVAASSSILKTGKNHYFRIGALIDAGEAKPNYAPAVMIPL